MLHSPTLHHPITPTIRSLPGPALYLAEGFLQLAFQVGDVEADGPRAVKDRNAEHHQVKSFLWRRLVRMLIKVVIDMRFEVMKISETHDRRRIPQRPGVLHRGRKCDSSGI